jgi:hypothetical protein
MKAWRWTPHALDSLAEREIERQEAEQTIGAPEVTTAGHRGRMIFRRRYRDRVLGKEMLLCVVAEQDGDDLVIVTVYKTSRIEKYLQEA